MNNMTNGFIAVFIAGIILFAIYKILSINNEKDPKVVCSKVFNNLVSLIFSNQYEQAFDFWMSHKEEIQSFAQMCEYGKKIETEEDFKDFIYYLTNKDDFTDMLNVIPRKIILLEILSKEDWILYIKSSLAKEQLVDKLPIKEAEEKSFKV